MHRGVMVIKCGGAACMEYALACSSGAVDKIPDGFIQREGLVAKGLDHFCFVDAQVL